MGFQVLPIFCALGFVHGDEPIEQEWSMARARGVDRSDLDDENSRALRTLYTRKNELLLELGNLDDTLEEVAAGSSDSRRWGSCNGRRRNSYGCGSKYVRWHGCQCNADCLKYDNCCKDYKSECAAEGGSAPTYHPTNSPTQGHHTPAAPIKPGKGPPYGHPSSTKSYPQYPGFTLWLVEEFDEPIDLDRDMIWTWSDGGLSEGDVRFVKDQIKFSDGKMMIEVKHNDGKTPTQSCSHAEVGTVSYKPLLSGEMRTKYNMFRYGRYEASIKAPTPNSHRPDSSGNYISTVFVYRDAKYTHWREIDVEITADDPHSVTSNMLNADHLSGWQPGIQLSTHGHFRDINTRTGFHTYAFEWLPDSIRWFIDGKQTREQKQGHLRIPDMSGKIMMNLWIFRGGGFGGGGYHNNQYPMHSEYDWFRFYKWDNEQHYPCGPDGACLTDKDKKILASNNPCDGIKNEGEFHGHICVAPKNHCNGPH